MEEEIGLLISQVPDERSGLWTIAAKILDNNKLKIIS